MDYFPLLGRFFYSFIFITASFNHFTAQAVQNAAAHGTPLPGVLVPLSGAMALAGGISILLGYRAQLGAWLLIAFLIPVTLVMHDFWTVTDPTMAMIQKVMFLKNMSMLGGAFIIAYFGSGPYSLDNIKKLEFENHKVISMERE
jgi:putative oxidoreductase